TSAIVTTTRSTPRIGPSGSASSALGRDSGGAIRRRRFGAHGTGSSGPRHFDEQSLNRSAHEEVVLRHDRTQPARTRAAGAARRAVVARFVARARAVVTAGVRS